MYKIADGGAHSKRDAAAIALVACATLTYEILLTRVGSLRLEFHYGYLIISLGMLALGSAGSVLYACAPSVARAPRAWMSAATACFALSLPLTWAFILVYPVSPGVRVFTEGGGLDWGSMTRFFGFAAGAALPFFTGGLVVGLVLTLRAASADRFYAADLAGAALGCLIAPLSLGIVGGGGALAGAAAMGFAGAWVTRNRSGRRRPWAAVGLLLALGVAPFLESEFPIPSKAQIMLEEGKPVLLGDRLLASRWSAMARVDIYGVADEKRSLFMRAKDSKPKRLPPQVFITQDGSAGTYLTDFSGTPEGLEDLWLTTYPMGTHALQARRVLVIGAGGAPDLWAARLAGAERIKAYELHRQIVDLHTKDFASFSADLMAEEGVDIVHTEGRSALLRETERFDLVQMSGIDTWSALTSGAYMLAENYLYTQEAFGDMFDRLNPDGAIQITRFSGNVEATRLLSTIHAAWRERSQYDFADCVIGVHANAFMAFLVKLSPITPEEIARLEAHIRRAGLGPVVIPGRELGGTIEDFVRTPDKDAVVAAAIVNVAPSTDDCPYFFNLYRWRDWRTAKAMIDTSMVVSQGNPIFLLAQLIAAVLAGLVLLLGPLIFRWLLDKRSPPAGAALSSPRGPLAWLAPGSYFGALGLGFIAIEITLMQELVLLVGHPLYSISVTLFAILLSSGVGSLCSGAIVRKARFRFAFIPIGLLLLAALQAGFGHQLVRFGAAGPAPLRFLLAALIVAPFGLLLGLPMAHGLRRLQASSPNLVPWAWATNAFATVVGSIATVVLSMNIGFDLTLGLGAAMYLVAFLAEPYLGRGSSAEPARP